MTAYFVSLMFVLLVLLAACRGEPVPRDYQNNPPSLTNPVDVPEDAPFESDRTVNPEPSYGVEGTAAPNEQVRPTEYPGSADENPPMDETPQRVTPPEEP